MTGTTITAQPGTPFIEVVREFDAPPQLLFRASTDPELLARWMGPREVEIRVLEFDARPGGRYRYVHTDDEGEYYFNGVFHTVVPNQQIVQTFEYEGWPGSVSLESSTFEDLGGRTRLRNRSVFPSVEARDTAVESGMEYGIRDSMDRLAALVGPARGLVVVDISMSLDGYVTGPNPDTEHGLGIGGDDLHLWAMGARSGKRDKEVLDAAYERSGAVIMGRRLFDFIDGPTGWSEEVGYGAERDQSDAPPVFVITHSVPEKVRLSGRRFHFVTDGLESALERAHAVAGGKDVVIMGGGETCGAFLQAGLVDELVLHLAPVVLGGGTPLFAPDAPVRLDRVASVSTPAAEHLTYRVRRTS
ncbi:SRPBCC domain-containing protein [Amycolatopsis magusensis]|uniref:SRPBCC domain-containing protein n=1 Tax=Amycolatopsis magusensis TaxID=882444 RepID=UPI0037A79EDB